MLPEPPVSARIRALTSVYQQQLEEAKGDLLGSTVITPAVARLYATVEQLRSLHQQRAGITGRR